GASVGALVQSARRAPVPCPTHAQRDGVSMKFARTPLLVLGLCLAVLVALLGPEARERDAATAPVVHGLAPLPNGAPVPLTHRPPGALPGDGGPSPVIFPAQELTIRFNHRLHIRDLKLACTDCHVNAKSSRQSRDS